jgi:hypothetical protein
MIYIIIFDQKVAKNVIFNFKIHLIGMPQKVAKIVVFNSRYILYAQKITPTLLLRK